MWILTGVEKSTNEPVAIATGISIPTVKAGENVDLMKTGENPMKWNHPLIAANPMLMALAWQSAMLNILMTPRKKPKKTAEIIDIKSQR